MQFDQLGLDQAYGQDHNPYAKRGPQNFQDEARKRALTDAVAGGAQPAQKGLPSQAITVSPYTNRPNPDAGRNPPPVGARPNTTGTSIGTAVPRQGAMSGAAAALRDNNGSGFFGALTGAAGGAASALTGMSGGAKSGGVQRMAPQQTALQQALDPEAPGQGAPTGGYAPTDPAPPVGAAPNTANWKTNEYAKPLHTAANAGGVLAGWDPTKWANPDHQTPKYVGGRIFSQYDPNDPAQIAAAGAEFAKAYPGATFNGKDKLILPSGETIDFVTGASSAGPKGWAWQSSLDQGGPGAAGGPGAQGSPIGGLDMGRVRSNNTQEGGDALQLIYQLLGPLSGQLLGGRDSSKSALEAALGGML